MSNEEKIKRYLNGHMSTHERQAFEAQVETDDQLATMLEEGKILWQTREFLIADELKRELTTIKKPDKKVKWFFWLLAIIILLGVLRIINSLKSFPSDKLPINELPRPDIKDEIPEEITIPNKVEQRSDPPATLTRRRNLKQMAMEAYGEGPNWSISRSSGDSTSTLDSAISAYSVEDFRRCLDLLERVESPQSSIPVRELKAHALYHVNDYDTAAILLKEIADSKQIPYFERSQWYYVLCQLAAAKWENQSTQEMVKILMQDTDHDFHRSMERLKQLLQ